jgi:DNA-binding response OmpR family regulator
MTSAEARDTFARMGALRILVIAAEAAVGAATVAILDAAGYATELAQDVPSGIAAGQNYAFDLVITDVVLGVGGDGSDVADALLAIQPHLKVIFMSAYAGTHYGSGLDDPVLLKPFGAKDLLARVEHQLGGKK